MRGGTISDVKSKNFVGYGIVTYLLDISSSLAGRDALLTFEYLFYYYGQEFHGCIERLYLR